MPQYIPKQPTPKTQQLALTIAQLEGYNKKGTLAQRQNNPGNLRYVGQPRAVRGKYGFAVFANPRAGFDALHNQIILDASRGLTLQQFVYKYAPPTENNTKSYLNYISGKLQAQPQMRLGKVLGY